MSTANRCQRALVLILAVFTAGLGVGQPARAADGPTAGYWLAGADGKVYRFGSAPEFGSAANLNQPVVCMTSTASGGGYWLVGPRRRRVRLRRRRLPRVDRRHRLNQPIVGMAATPSGRGYWLVAGDGGVFAFGDAAFFGSTGAIRLNQPIVGMAATPSGHGYWLVARDGGVFAFGDAAFFGSTGGDQAEPADHRHGRHPDRRRLLARRRPTAASSPSATAGSSGRRPGGRPATRRSASPPPRRARATGWRPGTAASSPSAMHPSPARPPEPPPTPWSASPPSAAPADAAASRTPSDTPSDRLAEATRFAAGRAGMAGFALIDTTNGKVHGNGNGGVALRTASIVKVIIGMRLFARAQEQKRGLTAAEQSDLAAMIRGPATTTPPAACGRHSAGRR